jgi:hypothetical protein
LSIPQREQYIKAVKCLQSLPATSAFEGVKTRFDDFQALHINQTDAVHFVVWKLINPLVTSVIGRMYSRDIFFRGIADSWVYLRELYAMNVDTKTGTRTFPPFSGSYVYLTHITPFNF